MINRVYIAGKLNSDAVGYIKNIHNMIYWAEKVRRAGFSVYIPAIDFIVGIVKGDLEYSDFFDNSQPWLLASDAVFLVPGWETSEGTKREIDTAHKNNIPVFKDINELIVLRDSQIDAGV